MPNATKLFSARPAPLLFVDGASRRYNPGAHAAPTDRTTRLRFPRPPCVGPIAEAIEMKSLRAGLPDKIYEGLQALVRDGWFASEEEVLREALRRFLETHRPDLMEQFIRSDVEWGLEGKE